MKKIIILLSFVALCELSLTAQVARTDSVFYFQQIPFVKSDTIRFNVLTNDTRLTKVVSYYIKCTRYVSGTTWRSIKNFGKIQILATGKATFVTTKPVDSVIHTFKYLAEGSCGGAGGVVFVGDWLYLMGQDTTRAWTVIGGVPGYYCTEVIKGATYYYIQMPDRKIFCTKEEYEQAVNAVH